MKKYSTQKRQATFSCIEIAKNKTVYCFALAVLFFSFPFFSNAQFVRTYNTSPQTNLVFNCISKSLTGTYFIAGIVDTSVYIAEVDGAGNLLREKLIGVGNTAYNLNSMITDADGNIVIVGAIQLALTNTKSFLMKISPALSLLLHRTYDNISQASSVVIFNDVKDYKTNSSLDGYYIGGSTRRANNSTGSDVLLVTVDRNTGIITNNYNGNRDEDVYDALVMVPNNIIGAPPGIFATGRISTGGPSTYRPWINLHNFNLAFTGTGAQYLQPINAGARLYSSSLIFEPARHFTANLVYCWHGDLNSTGFGANIGMGSFNAGTLNPNWQKEYIITPVSAPLKLLNQVAADGKGYVAEGNWWNGSTTTTDGAIAGEMFLLRTDKAGKPIWSRKLSNVFINQRSHNSGMLIDSYNGQDVIYAVGFKTSAGGVQQGVLVQMPITGAMDTVCAPIQNIVQKTYDYSIADTINQVDITMQDNLHYYPVDCIQTRNQRTCDSCNKVNLPSADYQLTGTIAIGNLTYFTVLASLFNNTPNSQWIVSDVTTGTPMNIETDGPIGGGWSVNTSTNFGGYFGMSHVNGNATTFLQLHKYRFQHILSQKNNCGITISDTVTKVIYMCTSCRSNNGGFIIVNEGNSRQNNSNVSAFSTTEKNSLGKTKVYPNPAGSTITFNVEKLQVINPVLQIVTPKGQTIYTEKLKEVNQTIPVAAWASGIYSYNIISNGKIIDTGKFMVQH